MLKLPLPTITHRDAIGSRIAHGALVNAERYHEVCGIGEIALVRQVSGKHRDLNRGIVQFDCRASVEQPISLHDAKLISQRIRSEEHTSELQSLMRISYAVFCLKKKKITQKQQYNRHQTKYNTENNTKINTKYTYQDMHH